MTPQKSVARVARRKKRRGTRQPDGTVAGLPEAEATEVLVQLVGHLASVAPELRRSEAACWLREHGYGHDQTDAFLTALVRVPGMRRGASPGELALPPLAFVRHRAWRLSLGRVDLESAALLAQALALLPAGRINAPLAGLRKRLIAATTPLLAEEAHGEQRGEGSPSA